MGSAAGQLKPLIQPRNTRASLRWGGLVAVVIVAGATIFLLYRYSPGRRVVSDPGIGTAIDANVYFPLLRGARYRFDVVSNDNNYAQRFVEWEFLGTQQLNGQTLFLRKATDATGLPTLNFLGQDKDCLSIVAVQSARMTHPFVYKQPVCLLPLAVKLGARWHTKMQVLGNVELPFTLSVESIREIAAVPAGTFKSCAKVRSIAFQRGHRVEGVLLYAPNVGLVRYTLTDQDPAVGRVSNISMQLVAFNPGMP